MFSNLKRASSARSVASCLIGLFVLAGCSNPNPVNLARPQPRTHTTQGLSAGYAGTATFDVPVVDPSTWQGSPMGTGTWSTAATPPLSGGPTGIGFYDSQGGRVGHFLMIGTFGGTGNFFGIVSDGQLLTIGTTSINNTTLYAGVFDAATGDPVALASSGTITLTAAGNIGGRITGTFTGTLDDVTTTGLCTSTAGCTGNEVCIGGKCVPNGCTTNAQCLTGQVCQQGQCVSSGCTSNAQCGSGQVCQAGQCVATPGCTSNAQCASNQTCQAGQCVTNPPVSCEGLQGDGSYSGKVNASATCSAFSGNFVNVTNGLAMIADDGKGLSLFVMDSANDASGAIIPLSACPASPSTVGVSNASYWEQTVSGGVTYSASHPASATVIYSVVNSSGIQGSFYLTLIGGSQLKGSFILR